jgi:hypothetical protein
LSVESLQLYYFVSLTISKVKVVSGSKLCIRPRIFFLRHKIEVCLQLQVPAALTPRKQRHNPMDRRLGGLRSRSGRCG